MLAMTSRYVALLRGVNVGGKNRVSMKPLARLFEAAGCSEVTTFIQSGNVVFTAPIELAATLPASIASQVAAEFGVKAPLTLRSVTELAAVVAGNPLLAAGFDSEALHVMFLADQPTPERAALLDPDHSPLDRFAVLGREVYLHFPGGQAASKFTVAYFDSKLGTIATCRNWRTIRQLLLLLQS